MFCMYVNLFISQPRIILKVLTRGIVIPTFNNTIDINTNKIYVEREYVSTLSLTYTSYHTEGNCIEYHDHGISPTDIYIHYSY